MKQQTTTITLTDSESEFLQKFNDVCDARTAGYTDGMQAAKRSFVELLIKQKGQDESVNPTTSDAAQHAAAASAANDAASRISPSSSTGYSANAPRNESGTNDAGCATVAVPNGNGTAYHPTG